MIENIELYKRFRAVAEKGNISAAAAELHMTQPALSSDIKQLEDALSTQLFFRRNRGVSLTPEGVELYGYVRDALAFLEAGEDRLREIAGLKGGTMRIGASDMTLRFYLLNYLQTFRARCPDVRLKVTNAPTPQTIAALRGGEIDFGVVTEDSRVLPVDDGIARIPVREIHDVFVCAANDERYAPLLAGPVARAALADYPLIMLEEATSTRRYVQSAVGGDIGEPDIELATSDLLLEFALRGIGVSSIVEDFAAAAIEAKALCKIELAPPIPPRRMCVAYLKKIPLCAAARAIFELMGIKPEKPA